MDSPSTWGGWWRWLTPTITRSELERRFAALVARWELPRPETNRVIEGLEAAVRRDLRSLLVPY